MLLKLRNFTKSYDITVGFVLAEVVLDEASLSLSQLFSIRVLSSYVPALNDHVVRRFEWPCQEAKYLTL